MKVAFHEVGQSRSRIVVIDDFLPIARAVAGAAGALSPFPKEGRTAYPGLRHHIAPGDPMSNYVMLALQAASPVIRQGFGAESFAVTEASFSLVTTRPEDLLGVQRVPHIDSDDPALIAILHHLHDLTGTGTGFYRHGSSGLERPDPASPATLRHLLREEARKLDDMAGGFADDDMEAFEKIFEVEARFNRLVLYQGCLLHSGLIPPGFTYSPDPASGRLTANIFVRMGGEARA